MRRNGGGTDRIVEIVLEEPLYERLKARAERDGLSETETLLSALLRGMNDFPLHLSDEYLQDVGYVRDRYAECLRDNHLLKSLVAENERLAGILIEHQKDTAAKVRGE